MTAPTYEEMMEVVMWEVAPAKQHLPDDESELPGTGPDGYAICEEGEAGYFAWLHHKAEAFGLAEQHNAAVSEALKVGDLKRVIEAQATLIEAYENGDRTDRLTRAVAEAREVAGLPT